MKKGQLTKSSFKSILHLQFTPIQVLWRQFHAEVTKHGDTVSIEILQRLFLEVLILNLILPTR